MGACLRTTAQAGEQVVVLKRTSPSRTAASSESPRLQHGDSEISLNSGVQVLSDKALRSLIQGSFFRLPKRSGNNGATGDSSQGSLGSRQRKSGSGQSLQFGQDGAKEAEVRPGLRCGICFTEAAKLSSPAKRWCGNSDCTDAYCGECLGHYVAGKIADALHFVPPVLCPAAGCRRRIPTIVWSAAAQDEAFARERYHSNASALLAIRCPQCDTVKSLLQEPMADGHISEEQILGLSGASLEALREEWAAFSRGEATADAVVSFLLKGIGGRAGPEGEPPARVRRLLDCAASLVQDEERRVCLQLAALRRFPKLRTPCCNAKMCFKCKVAGWHPRVSCEARQQRFAESSSGVQCCPSCGIPTQRTEGCLQMDCVCGKSWQWKHTDEELQEQQRYWIPLPLVVLCIPNATDLAFLRFLVQRRADLTRTRQSDGWTAAHFAANSRGDDPGAVSQPRNDATRLEALVRLTELEGIVLDMDAGDVDGDTPLSVALANGNVDAVRLLVSRGAAFKRTVWESLESYTPVQDREAVREILRPLVENGKVDQELEKLPLWLEFGEEQKALAVVAELEPGESCDEAVASAFLRGPPRSPALATALQKAFGQHEWSTARSAAATKMLWSVMQSGWPHRPADVGALRVALDEGARLWRLKEEGEEDQPHALGAALERQEPEAVELLLSAGAAPLRGAELGGEDCPLGPGYVRALELLLPTRAAPIVRSLAASLKETAEAREEALPLWLCLQLGLDASAKAGLEAGKEVGAPEAAAAIKRLLLNLHEGVANPYAQLEAVKAACGQQKWSRLERGAATALLHLELHQAHNFERDPDLPLCRRLLADFGADASSLSGSLEPEFAELAQVSSSGENLSPLMVVAGNCYVSPQGARDAAQLLTEFKADPNQPDEDGDTALFWALLQQQASMVAVLLHAGGRLSSDASMDRLQAWSHPEHLRVVAHELMPQLLESPTGSNDVQEWPDWMKVQFGLPGGQLAIEASDEEDWRELLEACLLSPFCSTATETLEASFRSRIGEADFERLRAEAASDLLGREVVGAFGKKWLLDIPWVKQLLAAGADVNMLLDLGDGLDQEEDWGDDHEDSAPNDSNSNLSEGDSEAS